MKKKILGIVFVILSLLFISAYSSNSSNQANNELVGKYYATTNDYDNELYHLRTLSSQVQQVH